jgi:hypothetical protein
VQLWRNEWVWRSRSAAATCIPHRPPWAVVMGSASDRTGPQTAKLPNQLQWLREHLHEPSTPSLHATEHMTNVARFASERLLSNLSADRGFPMRIYIQGSVRAARTGLVPVSGLGWMARPRPWSHTSSACGQGPPLLGFCQGQSGPCFFKMEMKRPWRSKRCRLLSCRT